MTPTRQWLTRDEVVEVVDERIKPIIAAQSQQANSLAEMKATQHANHEENRRTLGNVMQLGENQLAHLRGRDDALKEFETARQQKIEKWLKRLGLFLSPAAIYQFITLIHRLLIWHHTGHFFPPQGH